VFVVAQQIGRAQQLEWNPRRVGVMIVGDEVPHVHLHVVPINAASELSFATIDRSPAAEDLDDAADRIRARLRELGHAEADQ
jgi:histidine triad (HIT) family protein